MKSNSKVKELFLVIMSLSVLFIFQTCKTSPKDIDPEFARYIAGFTYGKIATDAFIQIELNEEIPAVELNSPVKQEVFSFRPALKGEAFWINRNTIRFIPNEGELKPGQSYNATFALGKIIKTDDYFNKFNFNFSVNEQNFTVDINPFSPINISDLTWNTVEGTIRFSNPVKINDVENIIKVKGEKTKVKIQQENGTYYRFTLDSLRRSEKTEKYLVVVDGSKINSNKKFEHPIEIPAFSQNFFQLLEAQIVNGEDSHIRLIFSDPLSQSQDITGLVEPNGIDNYTYRIEKNILKIFPEKWPKSDILLKVDKGLQNNAGLYLEKTYGYQLAAEDDKPAISIDKNGNILPDINQLKLSFQAVNLWAIDVKVIKIYEKNILYHLQSSSLKDNSVSELRRFGRLILKKKIRLDADKSIDLTGWNHFSLDLASLIKNDPGAIYVLQLSMKPEYSLYKCGGIRSKSRESLPLYKFEENTIDEDEISQWDEAQPYYFQNIDWSNYNWEDRDDPCTPSYFMDQSRMVETTIMASNIGIIAKGANANSMTVFANNILTTQPIIDADVTIYNYQMQPIGSARTNGSGIAEISFSKSKPFLITVKKDNDTGYLEVQDASSLSLSNFDVGGKEIQKGLKGYIYAERGVWRPGDSLFLSFILEDKLQNLPKDHPVSLEIYTPKRRLYHRQVKTKEINGFYTFSLTTDNDAETGVWQAYVKVGGTSFYKPLRIETIKPNRLKIKFETDSIIRAEEGSISATIVSNWLHGTPASNMKADAEITLSRTNQPFKDYKGYVFNNPLFNFETSRTKIFEGVLNANGVASIKTKLPPSENAPGILNGHILTRVYEPGGDMSFNTKNISYSPYSTYVGVKAPQVQASKILETDKPLSFDVVTVNAYGKPIAGKVTYALYKLDWSWWWDGQNEDLSAYVNNTAAIPIKKGEVNLEKGSGKIDFQINYPEWGRFLILVSDVNGKHSSGTVFYVDWPSWRGRSAKKDANGLTMLSFSTDKDSYKLGEKATVTLPKSSNGKALITIENGSGILHKQWVDTSDKEDTKYTFEIKDEMAPNFYVFAILLQPHSQTENDLPLRMYGVLNIGVDNNNNQLIPVIDMPDKLQPEKEFSIIVSEKNKKAMTYTLAVVDEGLLDLTSFKTPNALHEFYAREALGVRTWDLYDRVLGASNGRFGPLFSIGGDEALKPTGEKLNRFKPVVRFLGPFVLKPGEKKTQRLKLPQYIGSVRVMVVAGAEKAYGSAEKTVAVENDLMTLSTLPRILAPNEEVWLPVNVFVVGKSIRNVQLSIQTEGLLKNLDSPSQNVSFNQPGDKVVYFKMKAGNRVGKEKVTIKTNGNGVNFTETIDIEIRNPILPVVLSKYAMVGAGNVNTLNITTGKISRSDWAKLELSRLPSVNLNKNLSYLYNYPHMCTEQLISQAYPLLFLKEFSVQSDAEKESTKLRINQLIDILISRQLPDGGFVYWTNDNVSSEWVTSYAGNFLIEAKGHGYNFDDNVLQRWTQFQKKLAQNWSRTNPSTGYYAISMTELQQAYRLYTLMLNGTGEIGAMNRMREIADLSTQARWRLAAAYALNGKKDVANSLVFNLTDKISTYSFNNDTYGSPERDQAMIMETFILLDQIEKALQIAPSVAESLSGDYPSTQTIAFGLVAMSKLAQKMGKGNIEVEWTANSRKKEAINSPLPFYQADLNPNENLSVSITNKGKAKIYARLTMQIQPLTDTLYQSSSSNLNISVKYLDLNGKPIDVSSMKQGVEFTSVVEVTNTSQQSLTDMALTQVVASGWEIFNERLLNGESKNIRHSDIRDDRVLTYFNLAVGESKKFHVRLQAAYRGLFYLPAISCQAMYAPEIQTRTKSQWVEVTSGLQ